MKPIAITNFSVVREARATVQPGTTVPVPLHMEHDGFYHLEAITGACYETPSNTILFRLSINNGNRQLFQEIGLPLGAATQDGFYPIDLLSPGLVALGDQVKLSEVHEMDYLLPPKGIVVCEFRNVGIVDFEPKIALRFRKIKGVVWDKMLSMPRVENMFTDPREIDPTDAETSDDLSQYEVCKC